MNKISKILIAGLTAFAILISPVIFNMPTTYANNLDGKGISAVMFEKKGGQLLGEKGRGYGNQKRNSRITIIVKLIAKFTNTTEEQVITIMKTNKLNPAQMINTAILSKAGNISLDESAKIVAKGELRTYIEKNNLQDKFIKAKREFAQMIKGIKSKGNSKHHRKKFTEGRLFNNFLNVLARWSGIPTETISSVQEQYSLNPARTINAVVLTKISNIELTESASIVVNGELKEYLTKNNLVECFQEARQEIIQLLKDESKKIKEEMKNKIVKVLSEWSGVDKNSIITSIDNNGVENTINAVILVKIANISFDESIRIVNNHQLMRYLKNNNLLRQYKQAKLELIQLLKP